MTDLASVNDAGEVLREGVLRVGGSNNSSAVFEIDLRSLVDQWQTSGSVPKVTVTPTLINSAPFFAPASMDQFTSVGDRIFFTADDPTDGNGLYVSDGTTAGTRRIDMPAGSIPQNMTTVGDLCSSPLMKMRRLRRLSCGRATGLMRGPRCWSPWTVALPGSWPAMNASIT